MDHRMIEDCSSFFSVLGGSILTSRSLLHGAGTQEFADGRRAPTYMEECEQFLPVTEKSLSAMKTHMEYLWNQGLPLCIEVKGQSANSANTTTLLERWLIQTVAKRPQAHHTSLQLLSQAVQSFLHFSQIRSWAVFHDGSLPFDLVCRVCTPAEENWEHFTLCKTPEVHTFPLATVTNQLTLQVKVTYLPRSGGIPSLLGGEPCQRAYLERPLQQQHQRGLEMLSEGMSSVNIGAGQKAGECDPLLGAAATTSTNMSGTGAEASTEKCGSHISRTGAEASIEKCENHTPIENCGNHISRTGDQVSIANSGNHMSRTGAEASIEKCENQAPIEKCGNYISRTGAESSIEKCGNHISMTGDQVSIENCGNHISRTGAEASDVNGRVHDLHRESTCSSGNITLNSAHVPSRPDDHCMSTGVHRGVQAAAIRPHPGILNPLCLSSKIPSVMMRAKCGDHKTVDRSNRRSSFLPVKTSQHRPPQRSMSVPAAVPGLSLLGTFEESVLNGRIEACGYLEGFEAELAASGSFCPRHILLPMTTAFFDLSKDVGTSPYLGHIDLTKAGKKGYHIPSKGTIQVTLFNPNKAVVKIFIVIYDLSDMPPSTQTFLRQRTLSRSSVAQCHNRASSFPVLHYLIHLRFASSKSGRVYLHTDIRVIFARRAPDNDPDISKVSLSTLSEGPTNPKYSPIDPSPS